MSYIEGIGDEVVIFIALATIFIACLLLWSIQQLHATPSSASTNSQERQQINSETQEITQTRENGDENTEERPPPPSQMELEGESHSDISETEIFDDEAISEVNDQCSEQESENSVTDIRQRRLEFFSRTGVEEVPAQTTDNCANSVANGSAATVIEGDEVTAESQASGLIHIRLKYLDDTERTVESQPSQTIQEFKRVHFADDLANNRLVRLISNGYVLEDSRSLESYGLLDNSVIHVQIRSNQVNYRQPSDESEGELDLGQFLSPILGVALLCVWIMHFQYKEYFSSMATVALLVLSGIFLVIVWGQHGSRTINTSVQ